MDNKETAIKKLGEFKQLPNIWEYGNPTSETRSEINKRISSVRQLVVKAGTLKTFTIAPPPAIGGLIMKNVNPFTCIFDSQYEQSFISALNDCIDEAIGV